MNIKEETIKLIVYAIIKIPPNNGGSYIGRRRCIVNAPYKKEIIL